MKQYLISFLSVICLFMTGCIKEDLSDCDNVVIYFQYKADGDKDVLYQYMDQVDLYVFDADNHIKGVGHYTHEQLANFAAIPSFKLQPGRYKVVALGNAKEHTEVVNVTATDFNQIFIQHPNWGTADKVVNHDDNYLGQKVIEVPGDDRKLRDTVELFSAHIDVAVEIFGLEKPGRADEIPYELTFENSNAQTTFNNEINEAEKGTCYPALVYDEERKCYRTDDLALFRMDNHGDLVTERCAHTLVLKDKRTGEELVRGSIYNYLQRNTDRIDVTKQEALLPISIKFSSIGVTVEVPEWVIEEVKPEF